MHGIKWHAARCQIGNRGLANDLHEDARRTQEQQAQAPIADLARSIASRLSCILCASPETCQCGQRAASRAIGGFRVPGLIGVRQPADHLPAFSALH